MLGYSLAFPSFVCGFVVRSRCFSVIFWCGSGCGRIFSSLMWEFVALLSLLFDVSRVFA